MSIVGLDTKIHFFGWLKVAIRGVARKAFMFRRNQNSSSTMYKYASVQYSVLLDQRREIFNGSEFPSLKKHVSNWLHPGQYFLK